MVCPPSPDNAPSLTTPARRPAQTHPVDRAAFDELFTTLSNWGKWTDAGRGAYNRVLPEHVAAACSLVASGRTVATALPWNTVPGPDNHKPALHHMTDLGDKEAPEPSTNKDFIAVDYHGKAVSHLDALSHIAYRGELFNGNGASHVVNTSGAHFGTVADLGPFIGRGVLLDMPVVKDVDWLEPGEPIYREDLLRAEEMLGVKISTADAVLVRTGHMKRREALGAWDSSDASAGLHTEAMPLLAERGISLLGSDGDSDVRPSPTPGIHSPIHILAITAMGVPLLDNLHLEALSEACREEGRYEFLFTVNPLNIPTGTGSPVNPAAIF